MQACLYSDMQSMYAQQFVMLRLVAGMYLELWKTITAKSDLISVLARPPSLVAKINVITLQHVFVVALIPSSGHS